MDLWPGTCCPLNNGWYQTFIENREVTLCEEFYNCTQISMTCYIPVVIACFICLHSMTAWLNKTDFYSMLVLRDKQWFNKSMCCFIGAISWYVEVVRIDNDTMSNALWGVEIVDRHTIKARCSGGMTKVTLGSRSLWCIQPLTVKPRWFELLAQTQSLNRKITNNCGRKLFM